jgi:hypothetical protein
METILINMFVVLVAGLVKNPAKSASLQTQLLEIRDSINEIYPGK